MTEKVAEGMYSATAAQRYGTVIWADTNGNEHELTAIRYKPSEYEWPDAVFVAPVVKYVRMGRKSQQN